ncbi:sensor histidine kinase [Halalkalibacter alkalisediminis]|uniref:histidine kinase n=1 Tax=Halalkalibacter alkalisediminis TaxID=935616 RepID=A0ABV6NBS1_9BACI|nr:HAMP domain-containing sensor histidine kinase [Halalkalibacter alkalisediminis]
MDTKWKNKVMIAAWLFLFTFGLGGVLSALTHGTDYVRNYFHTDQFESQFNHFIDQLSIYELNHIPKEEVKALMTVSEDEVTEHRYRYGNLTEQVSSIKEQYDHLIEDALTNENQAVADAYTAERDKKIEDITNNFSSDEHIREKIINEKEQRVDEYYQNLEINRANLVKMKSSFQYYLRDIESGEVFTNVTLTSDEINSVFNHKDLHFIRSYPSSKYGHLSTQGSGEAYFGYDEVIVGPSQANRSREFEGKVAVPQSIQGTSPILAEYENYKQSRLLYAIYGFTGLLALLISFFIIKKTAILRSIDYSSWKEVYARIPIDLRLLIFVIMLFVAYHLLIQIYISTDFLAGIISYISDFFIHTIITTIFVTLTFIQGVLLKAVFMDSNLLIKGWNDAIVMKGYRATQQAFANRRLGTKLIFLLAVVFGFGLAFSIIFIEPVLIIPYGVVFLFIGLPILFMLFKRIGYFNRIIENTNHIVNGRYVPDLPVKGKSVLATLASDINTLKHGVKTSQKEQAKSERLKTELITNVSHDLRTPLTSIITYTELLKSMDLSEDDRNAYIQVIDRKSKRLKVLIDDLFEASKMASGNIELVKEDIDLIQLLHQALGEYNETIDESTLQFRISTPSSPLLANVDGQKMWRVFDNLIGNIIRYSLEHTRVYISVKTINDEVVIIFKNVTKYELGDGVDELFERFKRGDASRHTDGSGLGLAIAKSIVDLHGGRLDINVDGDLFKVTVVLNVK